MQWRCGPDAEATEERLAFMQSQFERKVDSVLEVLEGAVRSMSTSYRTSLLKFIEDPIKTHQYAEYYIWKGTTYIPNSVD